MYKQKCISKCIPALRGKLAVGGVWFTQSKALFDISVINTDIQSCVNFSPKEILYALEREKAKCFIACDERIALLTPLCFSTDGMLGGEAEVFLKRLGGGPAKKWEKLQ